MKDKLSALLDGELGEELRHPVFNALKQDSSLRTDWEAYCLIGDALRGDRDGGADFVGRVMAGLDAEATVLTPVARPPSAANSPYWRSLMPLVASLMGVAAVGWVAHTLYSTPGEPVSLASSLPARAASAEVQSAAIRPVSAGREVVDPHREYVFVHQAMTGGGPISGAIQNVRAVSDVGQGTVR